MKKYGCVYFMANKQRGVIYIGVTSNPPRRVYEHREELIEGFTKKYKLKRLVYYELYETMLEAIAQEKKLKNLGRAKKIEIIERVNSEWRDLYAEMALAA